MCIRQGMIVVVSAPSGAGKRTVLHEVMRRDPHLAYSVSATTRPPRAGEINGRDYVFLSDEEFRRRVAAGEFVEWAEVHGRLYGTLRDELERCSSSGKDVVLELDVQGMRAVKTALDNVVTVFIVPPGFEELERRIRKRGGVSESEISLRLRNARDELAARDEYDYVIVNDRVEQAADELLEILERQRTAAKAGSRKVQE